MKQYDALWHNGRLSLRHLLDSRREDWAVAWLLGMLTLVASIGLLALSGWFITAAGLAGMVSLTSAYTFNYFGPAAIIRLFAIMRTIGRYGERMASHNAVLALLADLRSSLFARLAAGQQHRAASMRQMHRLTSDIDLLNAWPLNRVLPRLWATVMLVMILLLAAITGGLLAVWMAIPLLCAVVVIPAVAARRGQSWAQAQAEEAELRRLALLQPLSAITALLQWRQWPRFADAFRTQDSRYVAGQMRQQFLAGGVVLLQQLCLVVTFVVLLWQGGQQVAAGQLSAAMLLALLLAVFGYSEIVLQLGMQMMAWGLSRAACARLNDLLPPPREPGSETEKPPIPAALTICAEHLCARFPEALNGAEDVNFTAQNGDILVFTGPSGAGKSTLLTVLSGELPPFSGNLRANGAHYDSWQWQGQIAYLAQQLDIFDLTLAQNLRLGKAEASDDELWQVLEKVALADWARAQPQGLDTPLGEYGAAVSGGQARRIALARLLLRPYALMLLDEPFAGLDENTRTHIATMLAEHQQHGILMMVSHQSISRIQSKNVNIDITHAKRDEISLH